ncbi:MAG: endonuclease NucS [Solirubrobacteraceae bacterium]
MRLIVARCEISYLGRLSTVLSAAVRLLMLKADGTFMVYSDGGGSTVKPLNWMSPPTVVEEELDDHGRLCRLTVRRRGQEDRLEISMGEILSDVEHELDARSALEKEGVERELQELLAQAPHWCGEGFRLIRREWPTDIGPVDLMCRDARDDWVAVEVKRVAGIDAVEQLTRYLQRIREDPATAGCRGVLVAELIKPQARVLAHSRGLECIEVDPRVLRGEREPALQLFAA